MGSTPGFGKPRPRGEFPGAPQKNAARANPRGVKERPEPNHSANPTRRRMAIRPAMPKPSNNAVAPPSGTERKGW
jgi:hypothetical protein